MTGQTDVCRHGARITDRCADCERDAAFLLAHALEREAAGKFGGSTQRISLTIPPETLAALDDFAERTRRSRSNAAALLIDSAVALTKRKLPLSETASSDAQASSSVGGDSHHREVSAQVVALVRLDRLTERRGRSRSQTYIDIKRGTFPPPVHVGERGLAAWPSHEVDTVLRAEIGGASADELRALVKALVSKRDRKRYD